MEKCNITTSSLSYENNQNVNDFIKQKIHNYQLTIGNLKNDYEDDEKYWKNIGNKIQISLIKFLSKNNIFIATNAKKNLKIFDHTKFYVNRIPKSTDWNQQANTFKIYWNYSDFDEYNETICQLKIHNFNDDDILEYFEQKILSRNYLTFNIDYFRFSNTEFWRKQILEQIKNDQSFIKINNQKVVIDNNLLDILWLDVGKIQDNAITFNLSYKSASTTIFIKTQYFLRNEAANVILMQGILSALLSYDIINLEQLHPLTPDKMIIDQNLFKWLKEKLTFENLKVTIFPEDFSLKFKKNNNRISIFQQHGKLDLYFKNLLVDELTYHFPNYLKKNELDFVGFIINNHCLLDLSNVDLKLINEDDMQKKQIIQQIYGQIQNYIFTSNNTNYEIGRIFNEENFEIVSVFLFDKSFKNNNCYLTIKINYDNQPYFLLCAIKYEQVNDSDLEKKWNEVFQKAYIANNDPAKTIKCEDLFACRDINDFSEAEVVNNKEFVLEKWKNIIGHRKVFLKNFEAIEADDFEIITSTLHHFLIDNNDKNNPLDLYSREIKKYFHDNHKKFNSVMINARLKKEIVGLNSQWKNLKFNFIFPLLFKNKE